MSRAISLHIQYHQNQKRLSNVRTIGGLIVSVSKKNASKIVSSSKSTKKAGSTSVSSTKRFTCEKCITKETYEIPKNTNKPK